MEKPNSIYVSARSFAATGSLAAFLVGSVVGVIWLPGIEVVVNPALTLYVIWEVTTVAIKAVMMKGKTPRAWLYATSFTVCILFLLVSGKEPIDVGGLASSHWSVLTIWFTASVSSFLVDLVDALVSGWVYMSFPQRVQPGSTNVRRGADTEYGER